MFWAALGRVRVAACEWFDESVTEWRGVDLTQALAVLWKIEWVPAGSNRIAAIAGIRPFTIRLTLRAAYRAVSLKPHAAMEWPALTGISGQHDRNSQFLRAFLSKRDLARPIYRTTPASSTNGLMMERRSRGTIAATQMPSATGSSSWLCSIENTRGAPFRPPTAIASSAVFVR